MQQENPFGEKYQKYWDRRHTKFSKFDEGIQTDIEGLYSVGPEEVADKNARKTGARIVVDGFCGIGGNTIGFAKHAEHVYAIEIDHERIEMAKNNLKVYGLEDKVTFIEGDYFEVAPTIQADAVFIAPPWGGPEYSQKQSFALEDFNPSGKAILDLAFNHFPKVVLQIPKNFDLSELDQFGKEYTVEDELYEENVMFKTVYFFTPAE
jgi:trimethylguanosine synthase